jgi:hypothetical protein
VPIDEQKEIGNIDNFDEPPEEQLRSANLAQSSIASRVVLRFASSFAGPVKQGEFPGVQTCQLGWFQNAW